MTATEQSSANRSATVSAVITTYNYAAYIAEAIDSVLGQSRPPDEIIVVDDGSTDDTAKIVAGYADRGVRYVRQENHGAGAARNRGIAESSGELIAFLDADDIWMPEKLERQLEWLASHPEASLVSGQRLWWHVDRDTRYIESWPTMSPKRFARELTIRNLVGNPSMTLIRRRAIEQAGLFDTTLRWGQDWEMFIRLAQVGEIGFLPEPVITYRWHRSSLSHDRRWERLATIHKIARSAIADYEPRWKRPVLRLRAWSAIEYDRARIIVKQTDSRRRRLRYALLALVSWPFDDLVEKVKLIGRALIGESTYQRAVSGFRKRVSRSRSTT